MTRLGPETAITVAALDVSGYTVAVSGFVAGVIEDDGTCAFTLSDERSTALLPVSKKARPDRSVTTCGSRLIHASELASGTREVRLAQQSAAMSIEKYDPATLEIP
jgi:hypothetical protein